MLPPCAQGIIGSSGLRQFRVVRHGLLGFKKVDGEMYVIEAQSFSYKGHLAMIDRNYATHRGIVLHEFGHWFDDHFLTQVYGKAWDMAVAADFAALSPHDQYLDVYLKDPHEAAAEIFSSVVQREAGIKPHNDYDTSVFPRASALMAQILTKGCS